MNEMFSQGGKGSTGILTNKQAVARHFGVKQSEVVYFAVGTELSGYKVIYDKESQRAYSLPAGLSSGTTAISLSTAAVLVHSAGSVDLGELAVSREEYVTLSGSFDSGATINTKNELLTFTNGKYRWNGVLPKLVPEDSTPESTGGINNNAWVYIIDAVHLKNNLADSQNTSMGDYLIGVKQTNAWAVPINQHVKNQERISILDLGGISGVANTDVDAKAVQAMKDGFAIVLPDGFDWKLTGTGSGTTAALMCAKNYNPTVLRITITCPDGRAKMSMTQAGLMLDQDNIDKFDRALFENIDFIGYDKQNAASRWMYAPEGRTTSNFITNNCTWIGFHTVTWATMIATKHYNAQYYGCGDTGAIVHTPQWTSGNFSNFNLNEWFHPRFEGKFGALFEIIGGFSNYFHSPWVEKVEAVQQALFNLRQVTDFQFYDMWLENFKAPFFINFDGDGTENTQSDIIGWYNGHINNNWSLDPNHSGQASGFVALINRLNPQNSGNAYDTKFSFEGIFEHPNSVQGWALVRTGSTLNLAGSFHIFNNMRLRPGQPNSSDGMVLGGSNPDLRRHFRDLSSNKFDLIPGNYQIISGRNTSGSQKDLVFDNVDDSAYFRRNATKIVEWKPQYFTPGVANTTQCGTSTRPWSGGFTQAAFTVTSDEHYKQDIQAILNDNEEMNSVLDAWAEVNFTSFRYIDRVELKGVDARWHFGVIAQRVVEAFERHGLDWTKYAFICFDKWDYQPAKYDEKTGELMHEEVQAGEKFGIRYEQALVLESALMRRTYQRLEERLKLLESK